MPTPQELSQPTDRTGPNGSRGIDLDQFEELVKAITRKRTERECLNELDTLILQLNNFIEALRVGIEKEPKGARLGTSLIELACSVKRYLLTVEHRMRSLEERMSDWEALVVTGGKKNPQVTFDDLTKYALEHKLELIPTDEDLGLT